MANSKLSKLSASLADHDYDLAALQEACEDDDIEEMEQVQHEARTLSDHTPLPSPNPKRLKNRDSAKEVSNENIYETLLAFSKRFEERFDMLKENTKENREEVNKLKTKVESLSKENKGGVSGERSLPEKMGP